MEHINILEFLTTKYREVESETDRKEISTLYWTVMDYALHNLPGVNLKDGDVMTSPILS